MELTNLQNGTITTLELVEQINLFRKQYDNKSELRHDTFLNIVRDEFEEEISLQEILERKYEVRGREYPMYELTPSQAKQVLVRESKSVRKAVIAYVEKLEQKLADPFANLSTELKFMIQLEQNQTQQAEQIQMIETKMVEIENNLNLTRAQSKQIKEAIQKKATRLLGYESRAYKNKVVKNKTFNSIHKLLWNSFQVPSYQDIPKKEFKTALEMIEKFNPNEELSLMIIGANAQMRMEGM